jgi:hypothetical protein
MIAGSFHDSEIMTLCMSPAKVKIRLRPDARNSRKTVKRSAAFGRYIAWRYIGP